VQVNPDICFSLMRKELFTLIALWGIFYGCAGTRATGEHLTDQQIYNRALEFYQKGKYQKAIETLERLRYSPSVLADDAHLLTAKAYIKDGQPTLAASELKWLINQYPNSELVEEASYLLGKAYLAASPRPELDQEYTHKAIDAFKDFLDYYPDSKFADSARAGLDSCYEKLAHKQYLSAELYYKMHRDSAAVVYINDIRDKYPDTTWRLWADFLEAKIRLRQGEPEKSEQILRAILDKNPPKKLAHKAQKLLNKIKK